MIKGHLDQLRKNQYSSKIPPPNKEETKIDNFFPSPDATGKCSHACYADCIEHTGQNFTDQTGRFILPSSTGNTQLLVLYDYNSNYIHAEPMKTKSGPEILAAYKRAHHTLTMAGMRPKIQQLDNECFITLNMRAEEVDFQLIPPGVHQPNT
jgi:hypothetical protein